MAYCARLLHRGKRIPFNSSQPATAHLWPRRICVQEGSNQRSAHSAQHWPFNFDTHRCLSWLFGKMDRGAYYAQSARACRVTGSSVIVSACTIRPVQFKDSSACLQRYCPESRCGMLPNLASACRAASILKDRSSHAGRTVPPASGSTLRPASGSAPSTRHRDGLVSSHQR
jgi:hypothetical protein